MDDKYRFKIGDWVQARSNDGELIHGYVETVENNQKSIKVYVVESDNEKAIGKYIWVPKKWTVKMPASTVSNERDLLTLIDMALLTKDEQWFMELSAKLVSTKNNPEVHTKKYEFLKGRNRIRNSEAKG